MREISRRSPVATTGAEVVVGDRLDARCTVWVHATTTLSDGRVVLAYRTRGSAAPGVRALGAAEAITVWRW